MRAGQHAKLPAKGHLKVAALGCRLDHATEHESSERICVKVFTVEEVRALLCSGKILDAFSALALYRYFDLLERSRPR